MTRLGRAQALWCVVWMLMPGCGYQVLCAGQLFQTASLQLAPFLETEPNGLSAPFGAALRQKLAAGGMQVTGLGAAPAPAQLLGRVHVGNAPSATLRGVQTYAVVADIHAQLEDAGHHVVWARDFSLREDFLPTDPNQDTQPLVSETRRRTALYRLAERAAKTVHDAMVLDSAMQPLGDTTEPT